jgi:glycosyltransferase involved in cell wall biosynthesis
MSSPERVFPFVPHIVEPPQTVVHMRQQLGIPSGALVFGRYGGAETFDLKFAHDVVQRIAESMPERYFLFMNTDQFCAPRHNIIFLEGAADASEKEKFINTCDAMVHARESGETFGLAIAEFAVRQRPVLTWTGSHERSHIDLLGSTGLYYNDEADLERLLRTFVPDPKRNWDVYGAHFNPHTVMEQFRSVFL